MKYRFFSFRDRIQSFRYALRGLSQIIRSEPNARLHLVATILVLLTAKWLKISKSEFCLLLLAVVSVWVAEAFNTALEIMADLVVGERFSRTVKKAKDIGAAAALIASIGALLVGVLIFWPKLNIQIPHFS